MSSHHIVREKQEPALLIVSLAHFPSEQLGQLLEWSPTVLVTEEVYEYADSLGIKIDAVVTDNPNFNAQEHTHIVLTEYEPLEDALKYLVAEGYPAVNIIAEEFLLKDYVLFVDLINLVIFTTDKKIMPIRSGFSKWQVGGQKIHLMHDAQQLQTEGLRHLGYHEFETEKDGFYALTFEQPFLFIAEYL
ncbi:MAG: thiamine pyrophosphokinase [Sphingobacteriaceae bacterium]